MKANNGKINTILYGVLSFLVPSIILCVIFFRLSICSGGKYYALILDLKAQQLSFYNFCNNISYGYNSFEYQTMGGLGGNAVNPLQMCCGIFCYFFSLVDMSELPNAIWWLIVLLIGISGLSEYMYLKNGYPSLKNNTLSFLLSAFYALSSCAIVYTMVPVWLCGTLILPLVILGIDRILDDSKCYLFIACSSIAIILNYYTAYMIAIFSVLYFAYRLSLIDSEPYLRGIKILKFFVSGLISVCLSSFSWIPVVLDLAIGKLQENRSMNPGLIRNPLSVLSSFLPFQYDGLNRHSLPFLFCGTTVFILFVLYFVNNSSSRREKIVSGLVFLLFIASFSVGIFDITWMFFSEPNGYPSRYSFIASFFVIILAAKNGEYIFAGIRKKMIHTMLLVCLTVGSLLELYANTFYLITAFNDDIGPYAYSEEYYKVTDTMNYIIDNISNPSDMKRIVKNWRYTNNDGVFFGYRDIDYSSSGYNYNFQNFMEDLGLNGQYHLLRSTGITPVVASVLGVSHFVQYGDVLNDNYSYIGSCNDLDVYYNENALPLAFSVVSDNEGEYKQFSDNPFDNINTFIYELSGIDSVYDDVPVVRDGKIISVFAEEGKQLWMYAEPSNIISSDIHGSNSASHVVYYDGQPLTEYADSISPYCVELGIGNDDEVQFAFDEYDMPQNVYIASYDIEKAMEAFDILRQRGAESVFASDEGIDIDIQMEEIGDVLITLPYENGYEIYVDGKKTPYYDYRDAFIMFPLDAGYHEIHLIYHAPGLRLGIIISLGTLILCVFPYCIKRGMLKWNSKRRIKKE